MSDFLVDLGAEAFQVSNGTGHALPGVFIEMRKPHGSHVRDAHAFDRAIVARKRERAPGGGSRSRSSGLRVEPVRPSDEAEPERLAVQVLAGPE